MLKAIPKAGLALGIGLVVAIVAYIVIDLAAGSPNVQLALGVGVIGGVIGWIIAVRR